MRACVICGSCLPIADKFESEQFRSPDIGRGAANFRIHAASRLSQTLGSRQSFVTNVAQGVACPVRQVYVRVMDSCLRPTREVRHRLKTGNPSS